MASCSRHPVSHWFRHRRFRPQRYFLGTSAASWYSLRSLCIGPRVTNILGTDQVGKISFTLLKRGADRHYYWGLYNPTTLPFALFFGLTAGYFRGKIDDAVQYVYTTLSSIPSVLLIIAAVLSFQTFLSQHSELFFDRRTRRSAIVNVMRDFRDHSWTTLCRLVRAEAIKLSAMDYVKPLLF